MLSSVQSQISQMIPMMDAVYSQLSDQPCSKIVGDELFAIVSPEGPLHSLEPDQSLDVLFCGPDLKAMSKSTFEADQIFIQAESRERRKSAAWGLKRPTASKTKSTTALSLCEVSDAPPVPIIEQGHHSTMKSAIASLAKSVINAATSPSSRQESFEVSTSFHDVGTHHPEKLPLSQEQCRPNKLPHQHDQPLNLTVMPKSPLKTSSTMPYSASGSFNTSAKSLNVQKAEIILPTKELGNDSSELSECETNSNQDSVIAGVRADSVRGLPRKSQTKSVRASALYDSQTSTFQREGTDPHENFMKRGSTISHSSFRDYRRSNFGPAALRSVHSKDGASSSNFSVDSKVKSPVNLAQSIQFPSTSANSISKYSRDALESADGAFANPPKKLSLNTRFARQSSARESIYSVIVGHATVARYNTHGSLASLENLENKSNLGSLSIFHVFFKLGLNPMSAISVNWEFFMSIIYFTTIWIIPVIIGFNINYASIVGTVSAIAMGVDASGRLYKQKIDELNDYMRWKDLSEMTRRKVLKYYEIKYRGKYFEEATLLNEMNDSLRMEITTHNCRQLISKVPFLKREVGDGRDELFLGRIAAVLSPCYYVAGDVVITAGDVGSEMFFILAGTVCIIVNGSRVGSLSEGSFFGELAIIANIPRTATVRAESSCTLYKLKQADFMRILPEFEDMKGRINEIYEQRMAKFHQESKQRDVKTQK
ncbi:Potassium voltage-gated channel sub H member 7 [Entophlyctis luteolus]|nr:Potassium voltage-gated channel sub H member 7 [Entophlyctis luteolus]